MIVKLELYFKPWTKWRIWFEGQSYVVALFDSGAKKVKRLSTVFNKVTEIEDQIKRQYLYERMDTVKCMLERTYRHSLVKFMSD